MPQPPEEYQIVQLPPQPVQEQSIPAPLTTSFVQPDENNIGNEGAASIAQALSNLTNLTQLTLDLCENNIGNEGATSIA
jgi:hypothetical protein